MQTFRLKDMIRMRGEQESRCIDERRTGKKVLETDDRVQEQLVDDRAIEAAQVNTIT